MLQKAGVDDETTGGVESGSASGAPLMEPAEVDAYVAAFYAFHPHQAIWDGRHEHDGRVPDFSRPAVQRRIAELERWGERVGTQSAEGAPCGPDVACMDPVATQPLLSAQARDLARVASARVEELFRWRERRPHECNPSFYQGALDVSIYVKRPYAPAAERLDALTRHLSHIPDLLASARVTLRPPLPRLLVEHAIHTYRALADYYERPLRTAGMELAGERRSAPAFTGAIRAASLAVREFTAYLRDQLVEADGDFRTGAATLARMIRAEELVDLPLERLRVVAEADLARHHARADELAARLGLSTAEAFAALGWAHMPERAIVTTVARAVEDVRAFLAASPMIDVRVAGDARCYAAETPAFMRAGSAFMDAPGPFERPGQPAYLYVTLPDPEWPEQLRADWLAKLNPWGLSNTAAHEAYPGHLLQFLHLARNPSSAARAFTSYACIEGWAHYAEQLLVEAGYGAADPHMELAQLSMALLRDCRLLVALDLHAGSASLEQAADLIAAHTHLAPVRCRQEALRGAQDPGYLYYTLGRLMLLKLRADYQRQEGQGYQPRRFHDAFLACGAPPLPLARRMLLRTPAGDPL